MVDPVEGFNGTRFGILVFFDNLFYQRIAKSLL